MKKSLLCLIATVMLSSISFAQDFDDIGLKHNIILKALILQADSKVTKDNAFEFGQSLTNELFPELRILQHTGSQTTHLHIKCLMNF